LSNQALQDTSAAALSQKKLDAFTEISATLSQISASAGLAVSPKLKAIAAGNAQTKERSDKTMAALGETWDQVFDLFVTEVGEVIERRLEEAIDSMKTQGELLISRMEASSSSSAMKRNISEVVWSDDEGRGESELLEREHKRRRPEQHPLDTESSSIDVILQQMKLKVDQQTRSMQSLAKENSEVCNL
jgi:hypothetical protein